MKKNATIFAAILITIASSCTDRTSEVKKEVKVSPVEKTVVTKEVSRPTSVTVGKNGVQVQTKKVDVKVGN